MAAAVCAGEGGATAAVQCSAVQCSAVRPHARQLAALQPSPEVKRQRPPPSKVIPKSGVNDPLPSAVCLRVGPLSEAHAVCLCLFQLDPTKPGHCLFDLLPV
jgi:hypothetical protein